MGCNFCVRASFVGSLQYLECLGILALAKRDPAQAVLDVGIVGGQLQGLRDQLAGFNETDIAIGQGVTQGIKGLGIFGFELDQIAQQAFHFVKAFELFADQGHF